MQSDGIPQSNSCDKDIRMSHLISLEGFNNISENVCKQWCLGNLLKVLRTGWTFNMLVDQGTACMLRNIKV